jgi:hypothetical protein
MGLVGHALAGERPSPRASDAARAPSSSRALTSPRPVGRRVGRKQPVAILRIARFWPSLHRSAGAAAVAVGTPSEGLDAFGSEGPSAVDARPRPAPVASRTTTLRSRDQRWRSAAKWIVVMVLTAGATAAGFLEYQRRVARPVTTGSLRVETMPAGTEVVIGGKVLGITPVTLSLAAGPYEIQLGRATDARRFTVDVVAGSSVIQHIEMAPAAAAVATGALRIQTEPSKLPVSIDGAELGVSPLTVDAIPAGAHEITVKSPTGPIRRSVAVQPRETVSLIVSSTVAPVDKDVVAAGWLSVSSPVLLQLREGGRIIGTTESDRLMLPAGDHDLDLVNEALGFNAQRRVHVTAGKTVLARIDVPNGTMSLNAAPWAEVFVDGERVGETPIGNLSRPIGRHDVLFRHPQLGERHETLVVTLQGTARLGVDLRKK